MVLRCTFLLLAGCSWTCWTASGIQIQTDCPPPLVLLSGRPCDNIIETLLKGRGSGSNRMLYKCLLKTLDRSISGCLASRKYSVHWPILLVQRKEKNKAMYTKLLTLALEFQRYHLKKEVITNA